MDFRNNIWIVENNIWKNMKIGKKKHTETLKDRRKKYEKDMNQK